MQVETAIIAYNVKSENKHKQMKMADLGSGQYVDKGKYDTVIVEKEKHAGQIKALNTIIGYLRRTITGWRRMELSVR
nr:MAG TPA: hypothetical protein [Caudoviricetes sp.]